MSSKQLQHARLHLAKPISSAVSELANSVSIVTMLLLILNLFATAATAAGIESQASTCNISGTPGRAPRKTLLEDINDLWIGDRIFLCGGFILAISGVIGACIALVIAWYKDYKGPDVVYESACGNCGHVGWCCKKPKVIYRVVQRESLSGGDANA